MARKVRIYKKGTDESKLVYGIDANEIISQKGSEWTRNPDGSNQKLKVNTITKNGVDLNNKTVAQLHEIAAEGGVSMGANIRKPEMITAILASDFQPFKEEDEANAESFNNDDGENSKTNDDINKEESKE